MSSLRFRCWPGPISIAVLLAAVSVGVVSVCRSRETNRSGVPRLDFRHQAGIVLGSDQAPACLIVTVAAADSRLECENGIELSMVNAGDESLEIALERVSCDCIRRVAVDRTALPLGGAPMLLKADTEPATLRITWKVDRDEVSADQLPKQVRVAVVLRTNDPRRSMVRIEINTRLLALAMDDDSTIGR